MPNSPDSGPSIPGHARFRIRAASQADVPAIQAFLAQHIETSVFLLSGLATLGLVVTASPMSGNFRLIEEADRLVGVFCLTRKGDLLAQTGGRPEMAEAILLECAREPFPIVGVLAEWRLADALWRRLTEWPGLRPIYRGRDLVYWMAAQAGPTPAVDDPRVRRLTMDDYEIWAEVDRAFLEAEGMTVLPDEARRRAGYRMRADVDGWWGVFDGVTLVSTACLNAEYDGVGQVGGVYTRPEWRRRGYARLAMQALVGHHAARGLRHVVLFAAEHNAPARAMYAAMGFEERGRFGMFFGERVPDLPR